MPRTVMHELKEAGACIVVTGAAGGIGGAIADRLAADGWRIVATDLTAPDGHALPSGSLALAMDVADRSAIEGVRSHLAGRGIAVAGLVAAAGVLQDVVPFLDMDEAAQRRVFDVNYFGAMTCAQVFGAAMVESGCGGSIVTITSINEHRPLPLHAYAPGKAALGALTALIAGELGPARIRANAIAPGFTLTPLMAAKIAAGLRDVGPIEAHTPLGRLVDSAEIAAVASFLMSDDASAVTGASIPVDCGWTATAHWMNFRELGLSS